MLDLVEEEVRELLTKQGFDGANAPVIRGSALKALESASNDDEWAKKIIDLVTALDSYIPVPERDVTKPFLMPIEDIFSIEGRGTVVTGKIERGVINVGEDVEIVGIKDTTTGDTICAPKSPCFIIKSSNLCNPIITSSEF